VYKLNLIGFFRNEIRTSFYSITKVFPSSANIVSSKIGVASSKKAPLFLYRPLKWPIINFFTSASLAIFAACSAVECLVVAARFSLSFKKVVSWYKQFTFLI